VAEEAAVTDLIARMDPDRRAAFVLTQMHDVETMLAWPRQVMDNTQFRLWRVEQAFGSWRFARLPDLVICIAALHTNR
jgi:hypothetical protein